MDYENVEILFVEDSTDDAILTMRALKKGGFTNKLFHAKDGVQALDFIYCRSDFEGRNSTLFCRAVCKIQSAM